MKKILLLFIIILFFNSNSFSQNNKFFDAPFGGGGGYEPGWIIPDVSPINNQLKSFGVDDLSTSGLFTSGGGGFVYIGFVKYLRIGGMGFGGSISRTATVNGTKREAIYSVGGGGMTVEYTLPFIKNVGVSVGAVIGGGGMKLELYNNNGQFNWGDVWNEISSNSASSQNISRTISNTYWMFSPTINVDIPLYRFVVFRIGGGYQLTFANNWTIDNDQELSNVPSDLNANGFFIQSGIFLGFFSF